MAFCDVGSALSMNNIEEQSSRWYTRKPPSVADNVTNLGYEGKALFWVESMRMEEELHRGHFVNENKLDKIDDYILVHYGQYAKLHLLDYKLMYLQIMSDMHQC